MANAEDALKNEKRISGTVQPYMYRKPPFTIESPGHEQQKGQTIPRRNRHAKDELITKPSAEVSTIYENLRRAAAKFGNAKAIGSRKIIKTHVENKKVKKMVDGKEQEVDKKWTYFEMSGYEYMTFIEYEQMSLAAASGLRYLGLQKDDKMHLYGATRSVQKALINKHSTDVSLAHIGLACHMRLQLSPFPS